MINTDKPTTSLSNATRANDATLWSTITTTWATETRTWLGCISTMITTTRQSTSITNTSKP